MLDKTEKEIHALVTSLTIASGTTAQSYIMQQIDELHNKCEVIKKRIKELEGLTESHALSDIEFEIIRELLSSFKDTIDEMSIEQKRTAIRTFVKKIVWDGKNVHIYMFGSDDCDKIDFTTIIDDEFCENIPEPLCEDRK